MKQSINFFSFREAFRQYDRLGHFPDNGLSLLFDYLEEIEQDTGEEMELDVVGLCCDFCQSDPDTIAQDYCIEIDQDSDDEEKEQQVMQYLEDNTIVVGKTNKGEILYVVF